MPIPSSVTEITSDLVACKRRPEHDASASVGRLKRIAQDVCQCLAHAHAVESQVREVERVPRSDRFDLPSLRLRLPAIRLRGEQLVRLSLSRRVSLNSP